MKNVYCIIKNRLAITLMLICLMGANAFATIWPIPNGATDTLENFVELHYGSVWQPGDTIMLSDASTYNVANTIEIFQEVTIMGDPDLDERPVLHLQDNGFRVQEDTINVTIKNIDFNGIKDDDAGNAITVLSFITGSTYWKNIVLENIEVWGMKQFLSLAKNKHSVYDSLIIDNVICHDFVYNGSYGHCIDPQLNYVKYMSIANSTFYNLPGGFLKNPDYNGNGTLDITKEWVIEHNTFYKVGGNGKPFIQINDPNDGSMDFTFTNNIVSKLYDKTNCPPFNINDEAGDFAFTYSTFNNFDTETEANMSYNLDTVANYANVSTYSLYAYAPGFADTTNGDFTLPDTSSLLTAGSDGDAIGDPRWVPESTWSPGPHCHLIPNDSTNILYAYMENTSWYEAGDTLLLTSSSQYHTNKTSFVYKDVTIMGDPRLTVKPSFYFEDQGFNFKNDSVSFTLKNIYAIGWDETDSTSQGNWLVRADQAYDGDFKNVVIEEVEAVGFKGILQLCKSKARKYDTVIVNNCIFHDLSGNNTIDYSQNKVAYATITNTTVYGEPKGVLGEFWGADTSASSTEEPFAKKVVIDHNTFYNVVGSASLIAVHNIKDESLDLTFTNNIVSTLYENTASRPFRVSDATGTMTISNNVFHNFNSARTGGYYNLDSIITYYPTVVTATKNDTVNPYFEDPTSEDFTLSDTSSLLAAGTEEDPIGDPRWIPEAGVSIDALTEVVYVGYDVELTATVNISGDDETVTWSVENGTGSASIDEETGILTPTKSGTVTVRATSNYNASLYDELTITIEDPVLVTGISLTVSNGDGETDNEITNLRGAVYITAAVTPGSATNNEVSWTISDENLATYTVISNTKMQLVATGNACGTVTVTATATDGSGITTTIDIAISDQVTPSSVTVSSESENTSVAVGNTLQLEAEVLPEATCDKTVSWESSDESIATVSSDGLVTGVAAGTVTITAVPTADKYETGTMQVTVVEASATSETSLETLGVYPNPATDKLTVLSGSTTKVSIINLMGSVVLEKEVDPDATVDISALGAGIYVAKLETANQSTSVRIIIQ